MNAPARRPRGTPGGGVAPAAAGAAAFDGELSGNLLNWSILARLFGWMRPYTPWFALSTVLVLAASMLQVLLPVIISIVVIDHVIIGAEPSGVPDFGMLALLGWLEQRTGLDELAAACLLYATVQLAWAITGHAHRLTLIHGVVAGLKDLRVALFTHLETRSSAFYDRVAVGRLMTRVTNDVEALYEALRGLGTLIGEFVPFLVALAVMLSIDLTLTLAMLVALPVMMIATAIFRRATRELFRAVRLSVSALNNALQENLAGLTVVQLSGREQANQDAYHALNTENRSLELRSQRIETLYGAFTDALGSLALALILYVGAGQLGAEAVTLGGVVLFTRFVDMLLQPIVVLGEQTNVLFRAMASGERIFQALDWDDSVTEPTAPKQLPRRLRGRIDIRDLTFGYVPGAPVLQGIDLQIEAGETLAIVGHTGSGKSTLIRLLGRFYDVPDGCILLDGIDINRVPTRDLRRRFGVVLQDFHVFSGTVAENIGLGDPDIDQSRIERAARLVHVHEVIERMPQGYDSALAERGQNLSEGERQLLSFARVLVRDPEILVLDEATANVDPATEALIQDALQQVTEGRTSIIIAHRLGTIRNADRIIVMDAGRIVEAGNHDALMALEGRYAAMVRRQRSDREGAEPGESTQVLAD